MNIFMIIAMVAFFLFIKNTTKGKNPDNADEVWPTIEPLPVEEETPMEMEEPKEQKLRQLLELLGAPATPKKKPEATKPLLQPEETTATPPTKETKMATKTQSANTAKSSVGQDLRTPQGARRAFIYSEIFKRRY